MLPYLLVLIASFIVDCIPVFAPPAWMLMMLIMVKFDLNPLAVAAFGTVGTVSGRYVFSTYIVTWLGDRTLSPDKGDDLKFLGEKLSNSRWATFSFVFLYSLLPLSTTALFTASGLARVRKLFIFPPFFLGNLVGDSFLLLSGDYTIRNISDIYRGSFDTKSIVLMSLSLLIVLLFLFVNWRELLENKKLRLKLRFWR